jgi:zinc protease
MTTESHRGLAPARTVLDNGAVVLAKESRTTPAVTIVAAVAAGSIVDPPDAPGTAHFLSRVIDRGTAARGAEAIGEMLDDRGVALQVAVSRHQLVVSCTCLTEDFHVLLGLVAEVLREPALPELEVGTRRLEVVTSIRQDQDNPAVMAVEEVLARLYPSGHPYGRLLKGAIEDVERMGRPELAACHARHVGPGSLVLACVGDVESARVADEASRVFGDWRRAPAPAVPVPPASPAAARHLSFLPMAGKAQADIAYGFVSIARSDPAFQAFSILNNVLGQYALGGRLGDSIRERQGMAYYVFSAFEPNLGAGPLLVRAGVNPANVERAIASIDEELALLAHDGVTAKEFEESRTYLAASLPRMLETNAGIASFLLSCEQFGLGLDYDVRLRSLLDAVTIGQVNDLARRFLVPGRATIAVAGPEGGGRGSKPS